MSDCFLFDFQQKKHHADPGQNMDDARDSGDRGVQASGQLTPPHLSQASHEKAQSCDVQPCLVDCQDPAGVMVRKGKYFFRQHQQEEKEHSQQIYCIPLVGHICHQQLGNVGTPQVLDSRTRLDHPGKRVRVNKMLNKLRNLIFHGMRCITLNMPN